MDRLNCFKKHIIFCRIPALAAFFLLFGLNSCIESFEIPTNTEFDNVLIIEASVTDVMGTQRISLTRTSPLGTTEIVPEQNAIVEVRASDGSTFSFQETAPGIYNSVDDFAAVEGISYSLNITSTDGNTYSSTSEALAGSAELEEVIARRIINDDNVEGIEIVVNALDEAGQATFFRYSFEETYLIIAPFWRSLEAFVVSENPPEVDLRPRSQEEQFCYGTNISQTSVLFSTTDLEENRVSELPIHFLAKDDYFIAHRYSILVKQNVQSEEAFRYYQTLRELSGQENLLSQQQPGFLAGNILVNGNSSRLATGYFEVVSQTEKRIFFDYEDFFPPAPTPEYAVGCDVFLTPLLPIDEFGNSQLILDIQNENLEFVNDNLGNPSNPPDPGRPFIMVPRICGDCTVLGSNIRP
ncbi:MAG: DUF4249 domain-containing protein, partial [Bacteroidota bacterium]